MLTSDWLREKHLARVLEIDEYNHFRNCLTEKQVKDIYANKNYVGRVYLDDYQNVVGFCIFKVHRDKISCFRLEAELQRKDVVKFILDELVERLLIKKNKSKLTVDIDERETPSHLFYKSYGFKAIVETKKTLESGKRIKTVNRRATKDYYDTYTFEFITPKRVSKKAPLGEVESDLLPVDYDPKEPKYNDDEQDGTQPIMANLE